MELFSKLKNIKYIPLLAMLLMNFISLINIWINFYWIDNKVVVIINILYYFLFILSIFIYRLFVRIKLNSILNRNFKLRCKSKWINKIDKNNIINSADYFMNIKIKFNWFSNDIISVICETENSRSRSLETKIKIIKRNIIINYSYSNSIKEKSQLSYLYNHEGEAVLEFNNSNIKDFYYTNNDIRRISWLEEFCNE